MSFWKESNMPRIPRLLFASNLSRLLRPLHTRLVHRHPASPFSTVTVLRTIESHGPSREEYIQQGETHQRNLSSTMSSAAMATRSKTNHADDAAYTKSKRDAMSCTEHWEDVVHSKQGQQLYREFKEADKGKHSKTPQAGDEGKKRGLGANQWGAPSSPTKKVKSSMIAGDKTRVPKTGQRVQLHAPPDWVDAEVVEVLYAKKTVEGEEVEASKEEPMVVVTRGEGGKREVLSPADVYFD
jgi:hypothetical protein